MISHVHIGVSDFERAFGFYATVMDALGFSLKFRDAQPGWAGWKPQTTERPLFLIGLPFNREDASPGNGQMVALFAMSRAGVDAGYRAALASGGVCDGPPGLRPHYHEHYYGAYFRDPDGNKICLCCHDPVV